MWVLFPTELYRRILFWAKVTAVVVGLAAAWGIWLWLM